jgi:hypothetical protein
MKCRTIDSVAVHALAVVILCASATLCVDADESVKSGRHYLFPDGAPVPTPVVFNCSSLNDRQKRVRAGMKHAWDSYVRYAWKHDELKPITRTFVDWGNRSVLTQSIGLTAIESLDTLWLMCMRSEFYRVVAWLSADHTFNVDITLSLFETTIRVLGGLLSAYELSGEPVLLVKANYLGELLLHAFDEERPLPKVSLHVPTKIIWNPHWLNGKQSIAEVMTLQMEFRKLAHFTGKCDFAFAVQRISHLVVPKAVRVGGLITSYIDEDTGDIQRGYANSLGSRTDSYYEYLLKVWLLTRKSDTDLHSAYLQASNAIIDQLLIEITPRYAFFAEAHGNDQLLDDGIASSRHLIFSMDHLACFAVGMLALGAGAENPKADRHAEVAASVARVCRDFTKVSTTGLAPEIAKFYTSGSFGMYTSPDDRHNLLRPEILEAMFYMRRTTDDEEWADDAWELYESLEEHLMVDGGWTGTYNVYDNPVRNYTDRMESFFVAETLKYAYLAVADDHAVAPLFPLDEWVFNTEGHPLRVFDPNCPT